MGNRSKIANHPDKEEIELKIIQGVSYNKISRQYDDISSACVRRHALKLTTDIAERKEMIGDNLLKEVKDIQADAKSIYNTAIMDNDPRTALLALEKQQRSIELLSNMMLRLEELRRMDNDGAPIVVNYNLIERPTMNKPDTMHTDTVDNAPESNVNGSTSDDIS